jgi:hypothetical protein
VDNDYDDWWWEVETEFVRVDSLTVRSHNQAAKTATATDAAVQRVLVSHDVPDGTLIAISIGIADGSVTQDIIWRVLGNEARPTAGRWSDTAQQAHLVVRGPSKSFDIQAGIDLNGDGVLVDTEVTRTVRAFVGYGPDEVWEMLESGPYSEHYRFAHEHMDALDHQLVVENLWLRDYDGTNGYAYVDSEAESVDQVRQWAADSLREWACAGWSGGGGTYFNDIAFAWALQHSADGAVALGKTLDFMFTFTGESELIPHMVHGASTTFRRSYSAIFGGNHLGSSGNPLGAVSAPGHTSMHGDYWDTVNPPAPTTDQNHHFAAYFAVGMRDGNSDTTLWLALLGTGDYPMSANPGDYRLGVTGADFGVYWKSNPHYAGDFLTALLKRSFTDANQFFGRTALP